LVNPVLLNYTIYLITQQFTWSHSFADTCVIIDLYTVDTHLVYASSDLCKYVV